MKHLCALAVVLAAAFAFVGCSVDGVEVAIKGEPGLSAFEVAVKNGFQGTETEWLDGLRGPQGEPAPKCDCPCCNRPTRAEFRAQAAASLSEAHFFTKTASNAGAAISFSVGVRENPYAADGHANEIVRFALVKLLALGPDFKDQTEIAAEIQIGADLYPITLSRNPYSPTEFAAEIASILPRRPLETDAVVVSLSLSDNSPSFALENLMPAGAIPWHSALDLAADFVYQQLAGQTFETRITIASSNSETFHMASFTISSNQNLFVLISPEGQVITNSVAASTSVSTFVDNNLFNQFRTGRASDRARDIAIYEYLLAESESAETRANAESRILEIRANMEFEIVAENLIQAHGFQNVIVNRMNGFVNVLVKPDSNLTREQAIKIMTALISIDPTLDIDSVYISRGN